MDKAEVKKGTAHEIGCRLEDALEAAKDEMHRMEGANAGAVQVGQLIDALSAHVDQDLDEGKYDLTVATVVKQYVSRASAVAASIAKRSADQRLVAQGKIFGLQASVQVTKKLHDDEERKQKAVQEAPEGSNGRSRPVGVRPVSIKAQRLAEEAAEKTTKKAAKKPAKKPAKKRSRRRGADS